MKREYTALFPFGGLGGGALGFTGARAELLDVSARFRVVGGIDTDRLACEDFERLTGAPSLCADIAGMTPDDLRAFAGAISPDVVFLSPPCKGASGLLSSAKARTAKYSAMNELALRWVELMLSTWEVPPRLVLLENVPRLKKRAPAMLRQLRRLLRASGYVLSDGFHDCGEVGGLAQHRSRYLLMARHGKRVPGLLYQPPKRRVRAVGEVLGALPPPNDPAGGPMHVMPRLSWTNWLRLALIPAGGDWRDLPGVLAEHQARRELHRRHHMQRWDEPAVTIAGSGSNGPSAVSDPRLVRVAFDHGYAVLPWSRPSFTVAGGSHPGQGAYSVADPRPVRSMTVDEALSLEVDDPSKPPPFDPVIRAADGTWHRPFTTLELAVLQGFPAEIDGAPLALSGRSKSGWRERIGNAVPPPTAREIARRMLVALVQADTEAFALDGGSPVWVREALQ